MGTKLYSPYDIVRKEVIANDIRSAEEYWANYKHLSCQAPSRPYDVYGAEWKGWTSFLGSTTMDSFEKVRACVHEAGLLSQTEYKKVYRNLPCKAPSCPNKYYDREWTDWFDFLGKDRKLGFHPLPHRRTAIMTKVHNKSMMILVEACHYKTGALTTHMIVVKEEDEAEGVRAAFDAVSADLDAPHHLTIKSIAEVDKVTVLDRYSYLQ